MKRMGLSLNGRNLIFVLVLLVFLQLSAIPQTGLGISEGNFLGIEEIDKGMEGTGKTVVKGTDISTFSVEVVGVIDKPGELQDFIVVRASGTPIEKSGGVAQGMSGSPVYIDGKLIGALSRAAQWNKEADNPIALITPIKTMLKLLDDERSINLARKESSERESSARDSLQDLFPNKTVLFDDSSTITADTDRSADELVFRSSQAPVMVNDFSKAAFKGLTEGVDSSNLDRIYDPLKVLGESSIRNLEKGFSESDLSFHNVQGTSASSDQAMDLEPGGPLGVALAKGDLSIGALGTVTYKENDRVLGFGHRFLLNGNSNFLLTKAAVLDTVQSYKAPFKLGNVSSPVGTVTQDRTQGIMGEIGVETDLFNTNIQITETGVDRAAGYNTDLVKTSDYIGILSYSTIRETIIRSLNRTGPGTVKVDYKVTGENMPEPLDRTDIFFSYGQASFLPSLQVALFIDALAHNPFRNPDLSNLEAEVTFERDIKSGQIMYFATDGREYQPGDLLAYQVKIKNYRDDIVKKTGAFQLPKNLPEGSYVVAVYGGPRPINIAPPDVLENFDDWLNYVNGLKSYEHLSVELLKPFEESVVPMAGAGYQYESVTRVDEKFPGRVVYGNQALSINVTGNTESDSNEEETNSDSEG
ncbi:MAG: SpoIVB peptidase S55 domain-containing protein [Candidatus Bipolaricaulota bacterium]